jgi:conjugative relaxase-like TrwC/TraI family protein
VLTVAKVTQGQAGDYAEYLEAKMQGPGLGDYYLKDGDRVQAPGRWAMGAETVGCDPGRPVDGGVLRALMEIRRPDTGQPLRPAGGSGVAVAAIDATFSAPKSVSAVWALAAPGLRERIERAHERAIDRALDHSLRHVRMVRERVDRQTVIHARAGRLIASSWRHTTARSVGGQPPDPQLHSHVLLHGAVRGDGTIAAIDSRSWLVHRRELGAAYRTELARELSELGFAIRRGTGRAGRYFEIQGVPEALLERWSSRHHQVRKAIQARLGDRRVALEAVVRGGGEDAGQARVELAELETAVQLAPKLDRYLTTATRASKTGMCTRGELDALWRRAAREHRFDQARVGRLRCQPRTMQVAPSDELLGRLTEFESTFSDREARAVALEAWAGASIEQALEKLEEVGREGGVLRLADGSQTTRGHRLAEERTAALASRLAGTRVPPLPAQLAQAEAHALDGILGASGGGLSSEQREAIRLGCSGRQLVVIEGQAGTGKSAILTAVARAHRADKRELIVASTAALASERLAGELESSGVSARAYSLPAFRAAMETGALELGEHSTVIHEEAALASTREQESLLAAVEKSGARLIEVGDPRQSQPVGAGGLWGRIEQAALQNHSHVELTRNVRALDPGDRKAQRLLREHQLEQALGGYRQRGRIVVERTQRQAEDNALDAAHADRQAGKRTLVISQTSNEHLDELNARAQAIRHQAGELDRTGAELPGRPYRLYPGDEVQVRHTIHHPELGALRNGTSAQITDVSHGGNRVALQLSGGHEVELDRSQIDQADLRLAYAQHPFPAQGQTTDTAHLIVGDHATQEGSYVALTRARERTHIYASHEELELDEGEDHLAAMAETISRSEPETPSIDTPLAHEQDIATDQDLEREGPQPQQACINEPEQDLGWEL